MSKTLPGWRLKKKTQKNPVRRLEKKPPGWFGPPPYVSSYDETKHFGSYGEAYDFDVAEMDRAHLKQVQERERQRKKEILTPLNRQIEANMRGMYEGVYGKPKKNPKFAGFMGTTHFQQRVQQRSSGLSKRREKRLRVLYTALKTGQAQLGVTRGKYAIQFGGEPGFQGDYLVVEVARGRVVAFVSLLVDQNVRLVDTGLLHYNSVMPKGRKNPGRYGSPPAPGWAMNEILKGGFTDVKYLWEKGSADGPVIVFEAERQGDRYQLEAGRIRGADQLHIRAYKLK